MKNRELYEMVVGAVCRHTGYDEVSILERNLEGCVDARYMLVHILSRYLTDEEIAKEAKFTRQSVNYIRNHFDLKEKKWSFRNILADICNDISNDLLLN